LKGVPAQSLITEAFRGFLAPISWLDEPVSWGAFFVDALDDKKASMAGSGMNGLRHICKTGFQIPHI
jgi:hypothetical protein